MLLGSRKHSIPWKVFAVTAAFLSEAVYAQHHHRDAPFAPEPNGNVVEDGEGGGGVPEFLHKGMESKVAALTKYLRKKTKNDTRERKGKSEKGASRYTTGLRTSSATGSSPCDAEKYSQEIDQLYSCGYPETLTKETKVYAPTGDNDVETYPVVLFHPGSKGYNTDYDQYMLSIAKQCLIVIVPATNATPSDNEVCKTDKDLITAYKYANDADNWTNKWKIPQDFSKVDWSRIGGGGHSAGGHHLPGAATADGHPDFKALVYSHAGGTSTKRPDLGDCFNLGGCKLPSFFLTAQGDTKVPPSYTKIWFDLFVSTHPSPPGHAVYLNTPVGDHYEPIRNGTMNAYVGRFFACHLFTTALPSHETRKTQACDYIYGIKREDTPGICTFNAKQGSGGECIVLGGNPARDDWQILDE